MSFLLRSASAAASSLRACPRSGETALASTLELFLSPNWERGRTSSPSLSTFPPQIRLMQSGEPPDRRATSARSIGSVHASSSTSRTPAHAPAILSFATAADGEPGLFLASIGLEFQGVLGDYLVTKVEETTMELGRVRTGLYRWLFFFFFDRWPFDECEGEA